MNNQALYARIDGVSTKLTYLQRDITALQYFDMTNAEEYSTLLNEVAIRSEHFANSLRRLVFDTAEIPKRVYLADAARALDIAVTENDGMVEITIPVLLPRRKDKPTDFITAPLQETLSQFISAQPNFERFEHCVICFTHVYAPDRSSRRGIRDHDNIETKSIIDSINLFLLTDDAGRLCNIYNSSEIGDRDMTRISIMKCDMFPRWISNQKSVS